MYAMVSDSEEKLFILGGEKGYIFKIKEVELGVFVGYCPTSTAALFQGPEL